MRAFLVVSLLFWFGRIILQAQNSFAILTHEHTDGPTVLYDAADETPLSLVAWQRDLNADYRSNEVIFVVKEQARLALPPGTPFGDAGQAFWILPQSQNPDLLYLGINVERVPSGVFNGPLAIRLKAIHGPGYFMVWQATGPGQFNIRIDTRDGLNPNDSFMPLTGAHEHFNWGFSTTGVYCTTWQVVGQRIGESTNIFSADTTFVFHVQPLPPATNFLTWQRSYWPPGYNTAVTGPDADSDDDSFINLFEYAFDSNPTNVASASLRPAFSFVTGDSETFGALAFTRYKPALDLAYQAEAASALTGDWTPITNVVSVASNTNGLTERITIRDNVSVTDTRRRFYRLRVTRF